MRIITLLTDFGDYYAAQVKGVLADSKASVIDIAHNIRPQNILAAAYVLKNVTSNFPKGTVHVAVVDPDVGSSRAAIAIRTKNYWFVGPDNGLLFPAAQSDGIKNVYTIRTKAQSKTFHGKDVFVPAAVKIVKGRTSFLRKTRDYKKLDLKNTAFINRFGNIELPIADEIISVNGKPVSNYETYSDAEHNEIFSVIDSRGLRELATREGSVARKFNKDIFVKTKKKLHKLNLIRLGI